MRAGEGRVTAGHLRFSPERQLLKWRIAVTSCRMLSMTGGVGSLDGGRPSPSSLPSLSWWLSLWPSSQVGALGGHCGAQTVLLVDTKESRSSFQHQVLHPVRHRGLKVLLVDQTHNQDGFCQADHQQGHANHESFTGLTPFLYPELKNSESRTNVALAKRPELLPSFFTEKAKLQLVQSISSVPAYEARTNRQAESDICLTSFSLWWSSFTTKIDMIRLSISRAMDTAKNTPGRRWIHCSEPMVAFRPGSLQVTFYLLHYATRRDRMTCCCGEHRPRLNEVRCFDQL
ncbi:hypothetical protein EYF80_010638 [Liparis tanakae]|uniref:Uncharacterized protein n=1 Tax=Liparis tanakae TaxID=230148 RepID=A0A4Z2IMC1_9TELE|nr:hypothetical protein EYF80_010638 [Liparis tanakae]